MPSLVQGATGTMTVSSDVPGTGGPAVRADQLAAINSTLSYNVPPATVTVETITRPMRVTGITLRVDVIGSDAGAVTAALRKVPSGTAPGSGTLLHAGTFNLKGTADTNQTLVLSTTESDLQLAPGDSVVAIFTGVTTAARGTITIDKSWR